MVLTSVGRIFADKIKKRNKILLSNIKMRIFANDEIRMKDTYIVES